MTVSDAAQQLGGFSADGKSLLFSSAKEPASYRATRLFRVAVRFGDDGSIVGGGATSRVTDAFGFQPRASGDGKAVVFTRNRAGMERPKYRGSGTMDLCRVNLGDGSFAMVTANPGNDTDGWPLPDGSVVYISSRDGQNNVWRVPAGKGDDQAIQLTKFAPTPEQVTIGHGTRDLAVSADGKTAAFAVWDTLYTLDLTVSGAAPKAVAITASADSAQPDFQRTNLDKEISEQVISPDGKTLAVIARGEVFVRNTQEGYPTRRVTDTPGRERDLAWSPDGKVLYFSSDDVGMALGDARPGVYGIYAATVELAREDLTPPEKEKKPDADKVEKKDEPAAADPAKPADAKAESGDGKAASAAESKPKKAEKKPDYGKRWSESLRFKVEPVLLPVGENTDGLRSPTPSPDGKKLIVTRGRGELVLVNLADKHERSLLKAFEEPDVIWAGDSRHIIYAVNDLDYNSDIWLMDTATPTENDPVVAKRRWTNPVNLTRHPDLDTSPRLSADGKVLTFLSERAGENDEFDVWAVSLDRAIDGMTGYERDEYFKKAGEAAAKRKPLGAPAAAAPSKDEKKEEKGDEAKKDAAKGEEKPDEKKPDDKKPEVDKPVAPLEFDAEDAYRRVRRITSLPGAETNLAMTPGGDRIVFVATIDGERSLVSVDQKGGDRKVLQAGPPPVGDVKLSLTGDKVSFIKSGQVFSTTPKGGGKVEGLPIDAPVTIDLAKQQRQKFLEAARILGTQFYHPTLKGLNWPALTQRYLSLAVRTRTLEEFNRIAMLLFGELDGSHVGIMGGAGGYTSPPVATGYLGVFASPVAGGFRVDHVAIGTPADGKSSRLEEGDIIVAIDEQRLAADDAAMPTADLDSLLAGKAGKEVLVTVKRVKPADGAPPSQTLLITPMALSAWDEAEYWDEVALRRKKVDELSRGKLGYLHIRSMGEASVHDFERDLYAAANGKEGLIIDVRDNGGGSTADILLSSLTAPNHAYTQPAGVNPETIPHDAYPRDRRLIYGYSRPINVLINQNSFSNAEIFAHAIKTIGRGKLIGTATFGGVISTGAATLIDGASVRTPGRGWYTPDGTDMDNHGAQPDVNVPQTAEDEAAGRDRQLEAAVTELLGRVGNK